MGNFTLLYQAGERSPKLHRFSKLGGEVRIAFGEPGRHAAIWKVRAERKGEVYVIGRAIGKYLKVSLHRSGDWRYQWTQEAANARGESRIIDQWTRPPAHGNVLTEGYSILTMAQDIIDAPSSESLPKVVWLRGLQPGEIGAIQIAFMRANGITVEFKGWKPVAIFPMETGEAAVILAMKRPIKEAEYMNFERWRARLRGSEINAVRKALEDRSDLRALIHQVDASGRRYALDLAACLR
jgi:hypothetical protein